MNKETFTKANTKKRYIISVIAAAIVFGVMFMTYSMFIEHDLTSEKARYSYIAKNEAEHIATTIDCVMARTNTLKAMVQDHEGDTGFFDEVADDIYQAVTDETGVTLKNFALAPGGIVSNVYPLEGNEALVGFNFLDMSKAGNEEAKEAYEQGKTVLTNPFELVQGGMGMGGRSPVLLRNGDKEELWGLVTVTIDFDNLIEVLGLENMEGMEVSYVLSYIDGDGKSHIMQAKGNLDAHPEKVQFNVRNLTWELAVSPSKGWISVLDHFLATATILIISVFAGAFTGVLLELRESNAILFRLSNTDQLTGGANRMAYGTAISKLSEGEMADNLVYISADINGLKQTNDTLGHLAGDELISGASECLKNALSEYGEVYRIGGDEFAALIHADPDSLGGIIDKLHTLSANWKGKNVEKLSLSVGYATCREFPDEPVETLIKISDQRMYEEKRTFYQSVTATVNKM